METYTTEKPLILTMKGDLAQITLNRPKVHNALSIELSDLLVEAIQTIRRSTDIKFVVIKGAGNTFCAGDDIKEMVSWGNDEHGNSTQGANGVLRRIRVYQDMANSLEELDKMTICAVDGLAVGGGLEITMASDFVIATERAVWGMPEVDSGITPGWGGTTRMARYIGKRRTKEINIIGALMPAERAVEWGLWNRMVPTDQLDAEVEALLDVLRSKNQQACRQLKYIVNRGCETDLYTAQGFEMLSGGLSGAVNGFWQVEDADQGSGVTNFSQKGGLWKKRRGLAKHFWSMEDGKEYRELLERGKNTAAPTTRMNGDASENGDSGEAWEMPTSVNEIFDHMPVAFVPEAAVGVDAVFQFNISGDDGGDWYCVIEEGSCSVSSGIHESPTSTIKMDGGAFIDLMAEKVSPMQAFTSGQLQIEGDLMKAQLIVALFKKQ